MTIESVFDAQLEHLMSIDGVVALGIGSEDGRRVIVVRVREPSPAMLAALPSSLGGYAVLVDVDVATEPPVAPDEPETPAGGALLPE